MQSIRLVLFMAILFVTITGCPTKYVAEPASRAPHSVESPPPTGLEVNPARPQTERPGDP